MNEEKKTWYPIGTVIDGYTCIRDTSTEGLSCDACDADKLPYYKACHKLGYCTQYTRGDRTNVVWKKINQQEVSL